MIAQPNRAAKGRLGVWMLCLFGMFGWLLWTGGWKLLQSSQGQKPGFIESAGDLQRFSNHRSASRSDR